VLVLNNDTVVEPSCVSTLVASAEQHGLPCVVAPKILFYDEPERIWYAGGDLSYVRAAGRHRGERTLDDPLEAPRVEPITFITGCCFLMPAAVARDVGGFREDFFIYCEDVELSLRLGRAGQAMVYQPAARLLHREPPTSTHPNAFQIFHRDRNRRRMARQHYGILQRIAFAAWFYPTRAARLAQYVARRDWDRARAIVSAAVAR